MAIKDSIANLRKALRTTQTNAPAVIDTLIRGLDGVAEAAEEENTYSTDERIVGKWIDGSDVYEKVVDLGNLPNATSKSVNHGIENLDKVISMVGVAQSGTSSRTLPYPSPSSPVYTSVLSTAVSILTVTDVSDYKGFMIIRYTKSTASRSPEENDAKNDGDEEKKDNER